MNEEGLCGEENSQLCGTQTLVVVANELQVMLVALHVRIPGATAVKGERL
jgi:hypothetical protein